MKRSYVLLIKTEKGWINWIHSTDKEELKSIQSRFTLYKTKIKRELIK